MFSQFCYYSNAFTDQECDKIIELGLDTGLKDGVLGDGSHGGESRVDFEMRKSKLRFINEWDPGANWIFKKFWDHALKANRDWFKLHIESLESMQFTRYEGNAEQPDHYNYHQGNNSLQGSGRESNINLGSQRGSQYCPDGKRYKSIC